MNRFYFGHAKGQSSKEIAHTCLEQLEPPSEPANLGLLYATDSLAGDLSNLLELFRQETNVSLWVGTIGMGICATGQEYYDEPALALMLCTFPEDSFQILPSWQSKSDTLPRVLTDWLQDREAAFGIVHGDPTNPATPALIDKLAHKVPNVFFTGGLSSSRRDHPQLAGTMTSGGVSGVFFDLEVPVATDHTQGCTPVGPRHRITRAERNVVIALDDRPAVEVLNEDVGELLARDMNRAVGYIFVGLAIPGSDTSDYLVRNLMGIDEQNGLIAVGEYLEGQEALLFCRRDGNTAREDLHRMTARLSQRIETHTIRGGVYVSCLARGRHQFGTNSEELELIRQDLGDFPLVGFFANGEIFHNRLYGYTGVLTLFL